MRYLHFWPGQLQLLHWHPRPGGCRLARDSQRRPSGGTCFGISLTDQRLLSGQIDIDSFNRTTGSVYGLDGPAVGSDGWACGNEPLLQVLKAQHLMQLSTEFLSTWLPCATAQSIESGAQVAGNIAYEIEQIFAEGRYPMIELNDTNGGGGHVVVAYDITPNGSGGYDIYVYDSNNPYTSNEDTDGTAHAIAVAASVIHLESNGTWQLASTTEPPSSGGGPFQGGPSAIVVTDPASIPLHPTLATLGGIAPGLLFSSVGSPGSPTGNLAGAGRVTQVAGPQGRVLYNAHGKLDTNPATRLDAATFCAFGRERDQHFRTAPTGRHWAEGAPTDRFHDRNAVWVAALRPLSTAGSRGALTPQRSLVPALSPLSQRPPALWASRPRPLHRCRSPLTNRAPPGGGASTCQRAAPVAAAAGSRSTPLPGPSLWRPEVAARRLPSPYRVSFGAGCPPALPAALSVWGQGRWRRCLVSIGATWLPPTSLYK